jgi:hypothetical protein
MSIGHATWMFEKLLLKVDCYNTKPMHQAKVLALINKFPFIDLGELQVESWVV